MSGNRQVWPPCRQWRGLLAVGFAGFVVASDGTMVVGLLPQIGRSIGESPGVTGQAVTAFAVGYGVLAPLVVASTRRRGRSPILAASLAIFVLANLATAASVDVALLLGARLLAGVAAGVFIPTAAIVAVGLRPREGQAGSLAVVTVAAAAAALVGVPAGVVAASLAGWRVVFVTLAGLGALAGVAVRLLVVDVPACDSTTDVVRLHAALRTLVSTALWATGSFTFFTYIALVVHDSSDAGTAGLAMLLLWFGICGVVGAVAMSRVSDRQGPTGPTRIALACVTAALALFALLTAVRPTGWSAPAFTFAAIGLYGFGTWAVTPLQQHRLLTLGGNTGLLFSANASSLYAGVAAGSALGGSILGRTGNPGRLCLSAVTLVGAALVTTWRSGTGSDGIPNRHGDEL